MDRRREQVSEYLRTSAAYDILDDAVLGCLTDDTVADLFQEFGLDFQNADERQWFGKEIDYILCQEGG